jgi:diguanylate cyclase (GGDEF)-like protein
MPPTAPETSATPGVVDDEPVRQAMRQSARSSGLVIAAAAVVLFPSWSGFDLLLEPGLAPAFLVVRLACLVPILVAGWLLWRHPLGRRRPEVLATGILVVAQSAIVWMIPQVHAVEAYVLGLSIPLFAIGCLLAARPRWTVGLVLGTWVALAGAALLDPTPMPVDALAIGGFYLATATVVAIVAHVHRYGLAVRELRARLELEHEQRRTGVLMSRLERLSEEDPLTGLANRRRWDAELAGACAHARRRDTTVGLVVLDVDHFKQINDRHGHAGGDEALRQVAGLLSALVRPGDVVARLGGDELAVLLPDADLDRAVELAESLRSEAAGLVPPGFDPGEINLSLGVAAAGGDQAFPLELMSRADEQLYRAKITRNAVGAPRREPSPIPRPR